MQEAAAQGDGLGLVAGAGFEPAHEDAETLDTQEPRSGGPVGYTTSYTTGAQKRPPDGDPDALDGEAQSQP